MDASERIRARRADRRVEKTLDGIRDAFEGLILERDIQTIHVTDICARARINRKTFYRYYGSIEDVLAEFQDEAATRCASRISGLSIPADMERIVREFYRFTLDGGQVLERIVCSGAYDGVRRRMVDAVAKEVWHVEGPLALAGEAEQRMVMEFVFSTGIALHRRWVAEGKALPEEQLIELGVRLVCEGVWGMARTLS